MSLSQQDMRKLWVFDFVGEELGAFVETLSREWFELVCQEIFDPERCFWTRLRSNPMRMTINPASATNCSGAESSFKDPLVYFRFIGRVIGKAMFDRHHVKGHMAKHIYKHILGWPVQFKDLESLDEALYNNLKDLQAMTERGEDVAALGLNFTTKDMLVSKEEEVELVTGGKDIKVTKHNLPEYKAACLKYNLMDCVKPQLTEFLLGFLEVIPQPLLTVFDIEEFEQLMCGVVAREP